MPSLWTLEPGFEREPTGFGMWSNLMSRITKSLPPAPQPAGLDPYGDAEQAFSPGDPVYSSEASAQPYAPISEPWTPPAFNPFEPVADATMPMQAESAASPDFYEGDWNPYATDVAMPSAPDYQQAEGYQAPSDGGGFMSFLSRVPMPGFGGPSPSTFGDVAPGVAGALADVAGTIGDAARPPGLTPIGLQGSGVQLQQPSPTEMYTALDQPSNMAADFARNNLPEPIAGPVASGLDFALAPETVGGALLGGTGLLPNLLGKGTMGTLPYFTSAFGAGAGQQVAEDAGAPPIVQAGAGLLGGAAGAFAPALGRAAVDAGVNTAARYREGLGNIGADAIPTQAASRAVAPPASLVGDPNPIRAVSPTEGFDIAPVAGGMGDERLPYGRKPIPAAASGLPEEQIKALAKQSGLSIVALRNSPDPAGMIDQEVAQAAGFLENSRATIARLKAKGDAMTPFDRESLATASSQANGQSRRLSALTKARASLEPQAAPGRGGDFYVTMNRDGKNAFLQGPYATHEEALAHVAEAKARAIAADPWSDFDTFGTARSPVSPPRVIFGTTGEYQPRNPTIRPPEAQAPAPQPSSRAQAPLTQADSITREGPFIERAKVSAAENQGDRFVYAAPQTKDGFGITAQVPSGTTIGGFWRVQPDGATTWITIPKFGSTKDRFEWFKRVKTEGLDAVSGPQAPSGVGVQQAGGAGRLSSVAAPPPAAPLSDLEQQLQDSVDALKAGQRPVATPPPASAYQEPPSPTRGMDQPAAKNIDELKQQLREQVRAANARRGGPLPPPAAVASPQPAVTPAPVSTSVPAQAAEVPVARPVDTATPVKLDAARDATLVDELVAVLGLPRAAKTMWDLSAPGRQGLSLAFRHPKEWASSWVPMIRAWMSDEGMETVNSEIGNIMAKWEMPGLKDPIHMYGIGPEGKAVDRVPGFEAAGKGHVAAAVRKIAGKSERAYGTFLNYQKAKTFDTMASALQKAGETNPQRFKNLGDIIDHATGFGAAFAKGGIAGEAFFSQRYMTSRFQFLAEPIIQALVKRDLGAARAATENLVAFGGGMAGLLALGNETGVWDAELDPRSTDFGKIRVGPQRIDFGAGFLPLLRTAARMATGEAKSVTGSVYDIDPKNEALKFFRNKAAPIPSEIINYFVGENAIGEKNPRLLSVDMARNMFMPLIADAVLEAFSESGDPKAALRAFGSELVGGGTSTYGGGQIKQVEFAEELYSKDYDSLYAQQQAEINKQIADSGADLPYRDRNGAWWAARDDAMARWQVDIGEEVASDPFAQKALSLDEASDIEPSLVKWARDTYHLSRIDAEKAVDQFLKETQLNDYIQAYRKDVLASDPEFLETWDEAYENDEVEYAPPKWARDFVTTLAGPGVSTR